jgi:RNA-binding protein 26
MDTSPREPVHRIRSPVGNRVPKRSYYDRDEPDEEDRFKSASGRERGSKMPRRSGNGPGRWVARGSLDGGNGRGGFKHTQPTASGTAAPGQAPPFGMPMSAPGPFPAWMPPANPGDPMAAFLAAQAAAAWQFQAGGAKPDGEKKVVKKVGQRCKDYDEKGFCMKGDMCPYEHGVDHIVVPGQEPKSDGSFFHHTSPSFRPLIRGAEYDPNDSMLFSASTDNKRGRGGTSRGRGSRGAIRGGRGGRAELSAMGPSFDHSNTKLVVEHIPEDKLSDSAIKEFFGNFGTVENVEIQQHKNLAILKFATWDIAKAAYDSPAPIFDNRFVKVFWYKPADATTSEIVPFSANTLAPSRSFSTSKIEQSKEEEEEEKIDIEEVKRKQEERQKAYEEKMAKKMANEEAAKELQKRKEELLKLQAEEKKKLMDKLAKKHAATAASISPAPALEANGARSETPEKSKTAATTAALKAQLEALQAEAEALGIDHTASEDSFDLAAFRGRGRGRGRFSTRGGYIPRGRGFSTYRGRGSYVPRGRGGLPTMKLDNRTRKVAVTASDLKGDKEEAFRHYLIVSAAREM